MQVSWSISPWDLGSRILDLGSWTRSYDYDFAMDLIMCFCVSMDGSHTHFPWMVLPALSGTLHDRGGDSDLCLRRGVLFKCQYDLAGTVQIVWRND